MTETTFAKQYAKLKKAVALANAEALKYRTALMEVRRVCRRTCVTCPDGKFACDVAVGATEEAQ